MATEPGAKRGAGEFRARLLAPLRARALLILFATVGIPWGLFPAAALGLIGAMLDALRAEAAWKRAAAAIFSAGRPALDSFHPRVRLPAAVAAFSLLSGAGSCGAEACAEALRAAAGGAGREGLHVRRFAEEGRKAIAEGCEERLREAAAELPLLAGRAGALAVARAALGAAGKGKVFLEAITLIGLDAGELGLDGAGTAGILGKATEADYALLGIEPGADRARAKKAYRMLARELHPDALAGLDEERKRKAAEAFLRISEAYGRISALR